MNQRKLGIRSEAYGSCRGWGRPWRAEDNRDLNAGLMPESPRVLQPPGCLREPAFARLPKSIVNTICFTG